MSNQTNLKEYLSGAIKKHLKGFSNLIDNRFYNKTEIDEKLKNLDVEVDTSTLATKEELAEVTTLATHENRDVLDKFSVTDQGKLLFNNKEIQGSGGGGSSTLTEAITSNIEVGGINKNTTFDIGTETTEILKQLLIKYLPPEVKLTISPSTTLYEKGQTVPKISFYIDIKRNSNDVNKVGLYSGNKLISQQTGNLGNRYWIEHKPEQDVDSEFHMIAYDGVSETKTNSVYIKFIDPMYYGISNQDMTKLMQVKSNFTYSNITCKNQSVVFKYPTSYGDLKSITDSNGFENLNSFTKTTETINSVSYNVYTSGLATLNNFSYTFKF